MSNRAGGADPNGSTEQRILEAGAEEFRAAYQWDRGLVVQRIAERAQLSEDTVYNLFGSKTALLAALRRHLLALALVSLDQFNEMAPAAGRRAGQGDDGYDHAAAFRRLVDGAAGYAVDDPSLSAQMFLWSQSFADEELRGDIRASFEQMDEAVAALIREHFEEARNFGVRPRLGLEAHEAAMVIEAIIEGLAVRGRLMPEKVAPDLASRAVFGLMSAWVAYDDDDGRFEDVLDEYFERHRRWHSADGGA
ncbi:MAG: TetR family transcriptional regulator [Actinomycetota bacterium]